MDDLQKIYFRIAQNIRQYRVKNRLNQAILAEHTGLTQSMISRIENEKCHLDIQTAFKIANALGISLETLMFEEDMIAAMMPFFMFAIYEQHGQPLEVLLQHYIQARFVRPRTRVYQTENFYSTAS